MPIQVAMWCEMRLPLWTMAGPIECGTHWGGGLHSWAWYSRSHVVDVVAYLPCICIFGVGYVRVAVANAQWQCAVATGLRCSVRLLCTVLITG